MPGTQSSNPGQPLGQHGPENSGTHEQHPGHPHQTHPHPTTVHHAGNDESKKVHPNIPSAGQASSQAPEVSVKVITPRYPKDIRARIDSDVHPMAKAFQSDRTTHGSPIEKALRHLADIRKETPTDLATPVRSSTTTASGDKPPAITMAQSQSSYLKLVEADVETWKEFEDFRNNTMYKDMKESDFADQQSVTGFGMLAVRATRAHVAGRQRFLEDYYHFVVKHEKRQLLREEYIQPKEAVEKLEKVAKPIRVGWVYLFDYNTKKADTETLQQRSAAWLYWLYQTHGPLKSSNDGESRAPLDRSQYR